jgi:threonine/homoserine/homoserine lactone efflux protein
MSVSSAVVGFALVAGLVTVVPGLDTALVLRAAILTGPRSAFATALGIGTGALAWGAAAAVGVSALLLTSTVAYTGLRIVGAGYMLWLGAGLIRSAVRRGPLEAGGRLEPGGPLEPGEQPAPGLWSAWRRGVLTNLLNPKIGAFYVAMLPQFIPQGTSPLLMGILLALVHDLEGMLWFTVIILGAGRMAATLRRRAAQRAVDGATGSVLIGFGLKLGLLR